MTKTNQFIKIITFITLTVISFNSQCQIISRDFGLFLGTSQYNGDVNMQKAYYSPHLTAALMYRKTYNYHYGWRFAITYAELKGNDLNFDNSYQEKRKYEFKDYNIYEFSSLVEFNFFELTPDEEEDNFTPFVVGGLAIFNAAEITLKEMITIPMGVGVKYKLAPNLELMAEWTFRKTFTDKLDLLDENSVGYKRAKQISFNKTKDWYSLLGVTVVYNFLSNNAPCHIYSKKQYEFIKKKRRQK